MECIGLYYFIFKMKLFANISCVLGNNVYICHQKQET